MNRILLFITFLMFGTSVFGQIGRHNGYGTHSNWFFGFNYGGTWHSSDVRTDLLSGGGFTLGRSYFYRQNSPVTFDLRGRFLFGQWEGLDRRLTYVSPNDNILNGTIPGINYYAADSSVLRNFETNMAELNLELVMHFNRIREQTRLDPYIFGGLGFTLWRSRGDYFDQTNNQQYDYTFLDPTDDFDVDFFLDHEHETDLKGSEGGPNIDWMPHLGFGLGIQLSRRFSIGVEHKTTFARTDVWDGLDYNAQGNPTGSNDLYHYTSGYLRWYLRGQAQGSVTGTVNTNPTPTPAPCLSPTLVITDPINTNQSVSQQTFVLRADIRNVTNRNQITMRVNGQYNANFNYNSNSFLFSSQLLLNPGQNIIELAVQNGCGTVSDNRVVVYIPPVVQPTPQIFPPVVTIDNPPFSPETVEQSSFNFQAHVLNVTDRSQINVRLNGNVLNNFTFNGQSGKLFANLNLAQGNNTVIVTATNQGGSDSEQAVIVYNPPVQLPAPIVHFTNPVGSTTQTDQASYQISAQVFHVNQKQNITVVFNGQSLNQNDFTFNAASSTITFNRQLLVGANTVQVTGTNTVGVDSESTTIIYTPTPPQLPPVVNFVKPMVNPSATFNPSQEVVAVVQHVQNANQIQVWVNNALVNNFMFNPSSNQVTFTTGLIPGSNNIRVKGTNNAGSDEESTLVIYTVHNPVLPPVVNIESPVGNPALVTESSVPVVATVLNVESAAGVQVLVNNQNVTNFVFNPNTHQLEFVASLNLGLNNVTVKGMNSAGQAQDIQAINYKKPAQLNPPVVTFVNPAASGITVNNPQYLMEATVSNVSSADQIQVLQNGQTIAGNLWSFNANTSVVSFHTSLINGLNLFTVSATNLAGFDSKTNSITYTPATVPCEKPTVVLNSPSSMNNNVETQTVNFEATTTNITQVSQITVFLNGSAVQGWNFNAASKKINGTLNLNPGNNVAEILVKNTCGKQRITFLYYFQEAQPCLIPVINGISPAAEYQTQETTVALSASTLNISQASDVQFYVNGSTQPFNWDPATKILTGTANLVLGSNIMRFESINDCGKGIAQWAVIRVACEKPQLNLSSNVASGTTVNTPNFNLAGSILNMNNDLGVNVTQNGNPIGSVFNAASGAFSLNVNLVEGNNTFVVKATNTCGTESFTYKVKYEVPVVVLPPTVEIQSPDSNPFNTQEQNLSVSAQVLNVTSASQINVQYNGAPIQFVYNASTNLVTLDLSLNVGQNSVVITASNQGGTASDNLTVNYTEPVTVIRPYIVFTNPVPLTAYTDNQNYIFTGYIDNLTGLNQASAKLNGQTLTNFGQFVNGKVEFSVPVTFDNTHSTFTLKVKGTNSAGVAVESREVIFQAQSTDDPNNCIPTVGAVFAVDFSSVVVSSTKEISAVALKFHDNTTEQFDGLSGYSGTFQPSAANQGKCIIGVWIKSGCGSSSNDGIGDYVANNTYTGTCSGAGVNTDQNNSSSQIGGSNSNCMPTITTNFTNGQKTISISSSLNLNNVVLKFHDNTTQQFNNLVGKNRTLSGTGVHAGKCIIGAWIKSGCNSSTDGVNYGEYYENTTYNNECASAPQQCGPFFSLRSASWEFCMETPGGTVNRNNLAVNSNYTYDGTASSVYFYASSAGTVTVNGSPFNVIPNQYYLFTGNVQVKVTKNDPSAPGQWMICIQTNQNPVFGSDANRPLSPCEIMPTNSNPGGNTNGQQGRTPQNTTNPRNNGGQGTSGQGTTTPRNDGGNTTTPRPAPKPKPTPTPKPKPAPKPKPETQARGGSSEGTPRSNSSTEGSKSTPKSEESSKSGGGSSTRGGGK